MFAARGIFNFRRVSPIILRQGMGKARFVLKKQVGSSSRLTGTAPSQTPIPDDSEWSDFVEKSRGHQRRPFPSLAKLHVMKGVRQKNTKKPKAVILKRIELEKLNRKMDKIINLLENRA